MPLTGAARKLVVEVARELHLWLHGAWRAASNSRAFLTCALASRVAGEDERTCRGKCGKPKQVKDFTFNFHAKNKNLYFVFTDCKKCMAAGKADVDDAKKKISQLLNHWKERNKAILKKLGRPIILSELVDVDEAYIMAEHERILRLGDRLMGCTMVVLGTKTDFMISGDRFPDAEGLYSRNNLRLIPVEGQLMRMGDRLPAPSDFTIKIKVTLEMLMRTDAALVEANAATWRAALEREDPIVLAALRVLVTCCRTADRCPGRAGDAGTITLPELKIFLKDVNFCDAYTGGLLPLPDGTSSFDQLTIDKIDNDPPAIHNRLNIKLTHYLFNGFGNSQAEGGICWSRKKWLLYVLNQTLVQLSPAERAEVVKAHAAA